MVKKIFNQTGPGPLIAAAFIGPGTITLCTIIGAQYGLELIWAILLAIIAAIILQGMAVRIGVLGQKSIIQVIKDEIKTPWIKSGLLILIFLAIMIGNTAYEAGNISGAVLGLETLFGKKILSVFDYKINLFSIGIGLIAGSLLAIGKYKIIERSLIILVILMSISFLITAMVSGPPILNVLKNIISFSIPQGSILNIIGLVGTTIVPYNLFLHTELVREKWDKKSDLPFAIKDMLIALVLGGIISMSVIITAASIKSLQIESAADLATGLEPLFGSFAKYFLSFGLFAAGITSTITAPLAAAYVVCGCVGWKSDLKSLNFQRVWGIVILFGILFSATGLKLIFIIQFAQITNGILLPIIVAILLWIMNKASFLGNSKNNLRQNVLGLLIILISVFLSLRSLWSVYQSI
jgi:Mn2+/Fe2+ NRAMP family transporter|tara:strand:- start:9045 stop:10271 length:1227 start_codon:yes stop_codon:yes gene_type:complete